MKNLIPEEAPATSNCYLWSIMQIFDFSKRGYIEVKLDLERQVCSTPYDNEWNNMIWIPVLNLVFSTVSLVLIIKYFYDIVQLYGRMRRKYQDNKYYLETLPLDQNKPFSRQNSISSVKYNQNNNLDGRRSNSLSLKMGY